MKTRSNSFIRLAVVVASILYGSSAFALPLALTGRGSGDEVGAPGSCNSVSNGCTGANCQCYEFTGTGSVNSGVGSVNVSTQMIVDRSALEDNLACESASGILTLTQKNKSSNALALDYQGLVCLANTQAVFNGSFAVNGTASLGKFASALGSGTFTASVDINGTATFGNISGTLQLH